MFRKSGCFLLAAFLSFGVITTPVYAENGSGNGETEEVQEREDSSESEQEETIEQEVDEEIQQEEVSQDIGSESDEPETQVTDSDQPADSESLEQNEETEVNEADSPKDIKNEDESEEITILGPKTKEQHHNLANSETNQELLQQYLDHSFGINQSTKKRGSQTAGSKLQGKEALIYNNLKSRIHDVAVGSDNSTYFSISLEDLGIEKKRWSAKDLGVAAIVQNGSFTTEAQEAMKDLVDVDYPTVVKCLMNDLPYELYWFDKTSGYSFKPYDQISADNSSGEWEAFFVGEGYIQFTVAQEFKDSSGNYLVNSSVITGINNAISNAQEIVIEHTKENDYQKLVSYKEEICEAVDYNTPAAQNDQTPYGNPWQLIWVFDGDNNTDVVCEGYSKAFKYLCDLSSFNNEINCILVTGTMNGGSGEGRHMWNIVTMEDGKRYLTDITNCDEGSVGADDYLFLKGVTLTGSDTYTKTIDKPGYQTKTIVYTYDEDTKNLWSANELTLSDSDYEYNQSYTLVLDANGGSFSDNQTTMTFTVDDDSVIDLSGYESPTRDNYTFLGWSDNAEDYSAVSQELTLTQDTTLYAFWDEIPSGYTVTYDANGGRFGSGETTFARSFEIGSNFEPCSESVINDNENLVFAGWATSPDAESPDIDDNYVIQGNITVYAVWEESTIELIHVDETKTAVIDGYDNYAWFRFIPEETGVYIFTSYADEDTYGYLYDENMSQLEYDDDGGEDMQFWIQYELYAGKQYYFMARFYDKYASGSFPVKLTKKETVTVTYHANGGYINYDGDYVQEASFIMEPGANFEPGFVEAYPEDSLGNVIFGGWSTNPDASVPDVNRYTIVTQSIDVYAVWSETVTITFVLNGGYYGSWWDDDLQEEVYDYGPINNTSAPKNGIYRYYFEPEKDTYRFYGWSETETGEIIDTNSYLIPGNITLYAQWREAPVVRLHGEGGIFDNGEETYDYSATSSSSYVDEWSLPKPHRDGYRFNGWQYENGDYFWGDTIGDDGLDLYAVWRKTYKLTYDAGEGFFDYSGDTIRETEFIEGNWIYNPDYYPEHETLAFAGWYFDEDFTEKVKFSNGIEITEDITFYAKYGERIEFTFYPNGGYIEEYDDDWNQILNYDSYIKYFAVGGTFTNIIYPYRDGYSCEGWATTPDAKKGIYLEGNEITESTPTAYYAVWKKNVTVTFYAGEGYFYGDLDYKETRSGYSEGETLYFPNEGPTPSISDRDKYFAGWSFKENGDASDIIGAYTLTDEDITLYAVYLDIPEAEIGQTYTVKSIGSKVWYKFIADENTTYAISSLSIVEGDPYGELYDSNKNHITGEWDNNGNSNFKISWELRQGNVYYIALGSEDDRSFEYSFRIIKPEMKTVTYDANGGRFAGSGETTAARKFEKGSNFRTISDSLINDNSDLLFAGWAYTPDAAEPDVANFDVILNDMTVYAVWAGKVRVTYNAGEGFFEYYDPDIGEYVEEQETFQERAAGSQLGGTSQLPYPDVHGNKEFAGWYLDEALTKKAQSSYVITEDITLYARYRHDYLITFDFNGGYESGVYSGPEIEIRTEDSSDLYNYRIYDLEKNDMYCVGWSLTPDGELIDESFRASSDITLYAQYAPYVHVVFDAGEGSFRHGEKTISVNLRKGYHSYDGFYEKDDYAQPVAGGKVFEGWYYDEELTRKFPNYYENFYLAEDLTLYAGYADACTITAHAQEENRTAVAGKNSHLSELDYRDEFLRTSKEGYVLEGWSLTEGGEVLDIYSYVITGDIDLYPVWKEAVPVTVNLGPGRLYRDGEYVHEYVEYVGLNDYMQAPQIPLVDGMMYDGIYFDEEFENPVTISYEGTIQITGPVTLYVKYTEACNVYFHSNGGLFRFNTDGESEEYRYTTAQEISEKAGGIIDHLPAEPIRKGYYVAGWSRTPDGEAENLNSISAEEGMVLYAVWEPAIIVTIRGEGVQFSDNYRNKAYYDDVYELTVKPGISVLQAMSIAAYDIQPANELPYYALDYYNDASGNVYHRERLVQIIPQQDTELTVSYRRLIEVTLDLGDGEYRTINVLEGEFTLSETPVKEGYAFAGWYLDEEYTQIVDYEHPVYLTEPIIIYAKWEEGYTITLNNNGYGTFADGSTVKTLTVRKNTSVQGVYNQWFHGPYGSPFAQDSRAFAGWTTDPESAKTIDWDYVFKEDTTLYAVWTDYVTITLHLNGGEYRNEEGMSYLPQAETYTVQIPMGVRFSDGWDNSKDWQSGVLFPEYFTRDNFVLQGWYDNPDFEGESVSLYSLRIYDDMDLYAKWEDYWTITLDLGEGYIWVDGYRTSGRIDYRISKGQEFSSAVSFSPEHDERVFENYYLDPEFTEDSKISWNYVPEGDITVYAKYVEGVDVIINANGGYLINSYGQSVEEITKRYAAGSEIGFWLDAYPVYNDGKVLAGWSLSADGEVIDTNALKVTEPITVYAVWTDPVTVTFHMNGGEYRTEEGKYFLPLEETISVEVPKGCEFFYGWYGLPYSQIEGYLYPEEITKEGYAFAGWYTDSAFAGEPVVLDWYRVDADTDLYAKWSAPIQVTLAANDLIQYFDYYNPEEIQSTWVIVGAEGHKLSEYSTPSYEITNDEYYVEGWYTNSSFDSAAKIESIYTYVITEDITLYPNIIQRPANEGYKVYVYTFEGEGPEVQHTLEGEEIYLTMNPGAEIGIAVTADPKYSRLPENPELTLKSGSDISEFTNYELPQQVSFYATVTGTEPVELELKYGTDIKTIYINTEPKIHVTGITLDQTTLTLTAEDTAQLTAAVDPEDADNKEVIWSSSDETVAAVDQSGKVTAIKAGTAVITAVSAENSDITATCTVTVNKKPVPVTGITLDQTTLTLTAEDTAQLTATIEPEDSDNKEVIWSSSDETVAAVDQSGKVTAIKAGTAVITAVSAENSDITATCTVTVNKKPVPVTGITLDQTTLTLTAEDTAQLTATIEPEDSDNKEVSWSSSDETVAAVDQSGKVTAIKAGTAVITAASAENSEITAECEVTVIGAAVVEPVVDVPENFDQETAEAIKSTEDSYGLAEELNEMMTDPAQYIEEEDIENIGAESKLVIQTYVIIENLSIEEDGEDTILTLNITPMYRVVELSINEEDDTVITGEPIREGPLEITEAVEITIPVGTSVFGEEEKTVYIKHIKEDGEVYFYEGTYKDGAVTFVNPDGFSEFVISEEDPAEYKIGEERYATFEKAVEAVKDGETIWVSGKVKEEELTAEVDEAKEFCVENNSEAVITIQAGEGYEVTEEPVDEKTVRYTVIKTIPEAEGVTRIYGTGRYQTSVQIADEMKLTMGVDKFDNVILASGGGFADALSGSYLSYVKKAPIILTAPNVSGDINTYINNNLKEGGTVYVLGGEASVPESCLSGLNVDPEHIIRLKGKDRYKTSIEILKACDITDEEIIIASGATFPDSLSASAAKKPILLVNGGASELNEAQREYLGSLSKREYYIVGGEKAVSEGIQAEVSNKYDVSHEAKRVKGPNRYETSIAVAEEFVPGAGALVVAYSDNYPDGLCGGALAMLYNAPVILTKAGSEGVAVEYAESLGITDGYVLGGTGFITDEMAKSIFKVTEIIPKRREKING